jgi:alanine racemase
VAAPSNAFPSFSRPTWAEIDLSSLRANARLLRGARSTPLIAVIKANAYGHGAIEVARALQNEALIFAVASVDEGRVLREAKIEGPILLLSAILPEEADAALEFDLMPTLSIPEVARALNNAAIKQNKIARAHWKIDTGMGRVGTWHEAAMAMWRELREYSHLEVISVYTHFACADEIGSEMTLRQVAIFENTLADCGVSADEYLIHAANSAATMRYPQARYGAIRCGIALYGASPFEGAQRDDKLASVMSFKSRVTETRDIQKGRTLSYGATWTASRDSKIALIPLGYADGYPRALSNIGEVLLRGKRCRVVGRVTMDQILVDVTELSPNVQTGEIVTVWGRDETGVLLSIEEVAAKAGTISYELLCGVAARVPRTYLN